MEKGLLSLNVIKELRKVRGMCPVCGHALTWNLRTGLMGQWAHLLCDTKPHLRRYGKEIIDSEYNGIIVCSLHCNNAVQLNYKSQPVLCDELAEEIRGNILKKIKERKKAKGEIKREFLY